LSNLRVVPLSRRTQRKRFYRSAGVSPAIAKLKLAHYPEFRWPSTGKKIS
jgi:hypothetical protein